MQQGWHKQNLAKAKSGMRRMESTLTSGKSCITCYGISGSATPAHANAPILWSKQHEADNDSTSVAVAA